MAFYSRTREEHWLRDKHDDGIVVILEDDSMWEVHSSERLIEVRRMLRVVGLGDLLQQA
jgi:hypothetical protein